MEKLKKWAKKNDSIKISDVNCDLKLNEVKCKDIGLFPALSLSTDEYLVSYGPYERTFNNMKKFIKSYQ